MILPIDFSLVSFRNDLFGQHKMKRKARGEENSGSVAADKRKKEEDGKGEDGEGEEEDGAEEIAPIGDNAATTEGGGEAKIKFAFKQTTLLNKAFSFKPKPAPPKSKKKGQKQPKPAVAIADEESKSKKPTSIVQLPSSYDAVAVFESTCPFFAGSGLDGLPPTSTATTKPSGIYASGSEWEWEEDDDEDGEWAPWGTKPSRNESLIAAFNAVQIRRWVEEAEAKQEALFVDELRQRTEHEREKEREKERERERKEKEKEDAEAVTAAGKKKPAKTATGKRKGSASAAAATPGRFLSL
jgi:hypothetical protein